MRVAITGVGIAGPTLAYWLRRTGHDPVLFERAPAARTGGYLIDFWGVFAPRTDAGLMVRNLAVRAFALPWLGKPFWARSLHDDFTLPEYQMD